MHPCLKNHHVCDDINCPGRDGCENIKADFDAIKNDNKKLAEWRTRKRAHDKHIDGERSCYEGLILHGSNPGNRYKCITIMRQMIWMMQRIEFHF